MKTSFLGKEYIVMKLIEIKSEFFHESFVTETEVNLYENYLQNTFNANDLNIAILSNNLCERDFNKKDGIIRLTDKCIYNLDNLPIKLLRVLNDDMIVKSFITILRDNKANNQKMYVKIKYNN